MAALAALVFSAAVFAQVTTQRNTIYLQGGVSHNERLGDFDAGSGTGSINYVLALGKGFDIDSTLTYTRDRVSGTGSGRTINSTTFLEYYPKSPFKHVLPFVGAGVSVYRFTQAGGGQSFLGVNPVIETGSDINVGKLQFEPYLQFATPDLKQSAKTTSIGGGLNIYYNITNRFGLRGSGFAADNRWRENGVRRSGTSTSLQAGIFFSF